MSALKTMGILMAGVFLLMVLTITVAVMFFPGTDSQVQAQTTPTTPTYTTPSKVVDLDITIHNWAKDEYGYGKVVYSINNTGDIEVEYLKVKIIIKDEAGIPIGVHTTYPCEYGTLRPGQEVTDEYPFMPSEMIGASGVSVEIIDYLEV